MSIKDITVIIVTYKSEKKIISCIDSLDPNINIIVIENSNNKDFKNNIEKKYSNVKCFLSENNLGYAKANNIGLKQTNTKYALILNPDTVVSKNAIEKFIDRTKVNIDFKIIGPVNFQDQKIDFKNIKNKNDLIEVKNIKGFAMFLNMKKFNNIFFDENYFLFFEEIDLCTRIIQENEKIYIDPNIEIFHEGGKSVESELDYELLKNQNWHWMWSTFYYNKKYYGFINAFVKIFPKLLSSFLKFLFFSITLNKKLKNIYYCRLSGILNSILGKKSWYRPRLD